MAQTTAPSSDMVPEPVMEVAPGTAMRLWTEDAFAGRVTSATDRPSEVLNPKELNPQTGPFHVTGAEPGEVPARR